jgi:membrane peptidoglycan carboxypeptidase
LLAGLIRSPSTLDPAHDKAASEQRWHQVIDTMAAQKWLTPAQAATIRFPATQDPALAQLNVNLSPNGHYIQDRVIAELEAAGFSEDGIMRGGYRVMTSISPSYQNELEQAVQSSMPAGTAPTVHEGAEAIEPGTGRVLAYYAGSEYSGAQSKDAVHYLRANPGSTMKAITLATALANGYSLNSTYDSRSPLVIPGYYPPSNPLRNAEPSSGGPVTLTTATAESVNTVFVPLAMDVGVDKVQVMAERLGIDPSAWAGGGVGPSITLGASPKGIRVEDMATVYATLAAQGVRAHTHFVDTVLDPAGTVVYRANPNAHQVVGRDVMADTTYALEQVFKYGTASRGRIYGRPTAGKTGTVEDNKGAWFCGYVPQISLAVGVFNDPPGQVPPIPGYEGSQTRLFGSTIPLTIWRKFMVSATAGLPVKDFPPPAYVGSVKHRAYVPVPKPTPSATATPTPGVPTPGPTPAPTGPAATPTPKAVPTQPTKTKRPTPPAKHATRSPKP